MATTLMILAAALAEMLLTLVIARFCSINHLGDDE